MADEFETFRDPVLSLFQSAVKEVAKALDEKSATNGIRTRRITYSSVSVLQNIAVDIARREREPSASRSSTKPQSRELTKTGAIQVCAELAYRYMKALAIGDQKIVDELNGEFTASTCDSAWVKTLIEYQRYFDADGKRKPIPYIRPATVGESVVEIKPNARIGLMADWGTGASPAVEVLNALVSDKPDVVVHLGDIYYSGTPQECESNFSSLIERTLRKGKTLPVFTLSGNHDMYCGGVGFYQLIRTLNPSPFVQRASFFCLRSSDEKWQFLAMDTGLHDDNPKGIAGAVTYLEDDELEWHCDRIREFPGRTILLSHHQLFSAFSPIGIADASGKQDPWNPKLLAAFRKLTAEKEIAAWFWGHEHTLSIYKPFAGLERGRCVGHGAVPVSVIDEIYKQVPGLTEVPVLVEGTKLAKRQGVYAHGYALLTLGHANCQADYFQITDSGRKLLFREQF
jgi:hypothetical protein